MFTVADSIGIKQISTRRLLVGVGNEIHQHTINSDGQTQHSSINLNFKNKVFGIRATSDATCDDATRLIVAFGGRELAIIDTSDDCQLRLIRLFHASDWISSVHLYNVDSTESTLRFCLLTGHSTALEIEANVKGEIKILNRSGCSDKSTLYSSLVFGNSWPSTTIFGGTALGQIVIWKPKNDSFGCEVIHRLSGHNGVVFSINVAPSFNLMTTTSDDRSVKIWKLDFDDEKQKDFAKCSFRSLKSVFGHTARVFSHRVIVHDGELFIVSVGEDSNVCVWRSDGQLLHRQNVPGDATLWNSEWDASRLRLLTCGSDGNVNQIDLADVLNFRARESDILPSIESKDDEYFAKIRIIQENNLLIGSTNYNRLFYIPIGDVYQEWRPFEREDLALPYKSTILETRDCLVATAGYRRATIFKFFEDKFVRVFDEDICDGMIRSLKFLDRKRFLVSVGDGRCLLCQLDDVDSLRSTHSFELPPCKERWISNACIYENCLLISDRCGSLHLYDVAENGEVTRTHSMKHVHGHLGCTCLFFHAEYNGQLEFKSAGHDSTVKIISVDRRREKFNISSTSRIPINWCDKIAALPPNEGMLYAGFNDTHFVVWLPQAEVKFEYECGGGHRYWDLHCDTSDSSRHLNITAYFIRMKSIHRVVFQLNHPENVFTTIKRKWHTRACNVVKSFDVFDRDSQLRRLIFSGGDDNVINVSEIGTDASIKFIHEMILHISGIKTILVLPIESERRALVFSAGGRAQICVTELNYDDVKLRERTDFMLRPNLPTRKRPGKTQTFDFDPETRFMSLDVRRSVENQFELFVGCSDGYIRRFVYDDVSSTITVDKAIFYNRCLLHVHILRMKNVADIFLTMATDGKICFWSLDDFSAESQPLLELQHHHSGINSFDVMIDDNHFWIASGGDDQAVVVSRVQFIDKNNFETVATQRYPFMHLAQANGVRFNRRRNALYTFSVDQTICRVNLDDFSCNKIANSCISDAKGIELIGDDLILSYGCGIQVHSFDQNETISKLK